MSDIFGNGIWERSETLAGSGNEATESFSKIDVSPIKNNCIFWQKYLSIWVPQGVRETNLFNS